MRTNLRMPQCGSMLPDMVGAVIYVRVSTKEQTENLSLPTQLKACEEYWQRQGFRVLARFREEGESAKTADRTELQKLLQFCRTNKGRVQFVVVFNLTRFARDILAFAERVLPRAADLWVQALLDQRQRFQQLFFPDGIAFDGNRFVRTGVTAPAFSYLRGIETG